MLFPSRRGSAIFAVLLALLALGVIFVIADRIGAAGRLVRRSGEMAAARLLAESALEEARVRVLTSADVSGSPVYELLRSRDRFERSIALEPATARTQLEKTGTPREAAVSSVRVGLERGAATQDGALLDWPHGLAAPMVLTLSATATAGKATADASWDIPCRLTCARPPIPYDRVRVAFLAAGGLEPVRLAAVLDRIRIDNGPAGALESKISPLFLGDEPTLLELFEGLFPDGKPAPIDPREVARAASYVVAGQGEATRLLFPIEGAPDLMVMPGGLVLCAGDLELPAGTFYSGAGVLAVTGDLRVRGLLRGGPPETAGPLVLLTAGQNGRIVLDDRPVEAALLALGPGGRVVPASGSVSIRLHGLIAAAVPDPLLVGDVIYDPAFFNGMPEGPYDAPGATPAARPSASDLDPGAYRFTLDGCPARRMD